MLAVAHGTRDGAGVAALHALLAAVRTARPAVTARLAFVELVPPSVESALEQMRGPVVLVPFLLTTGWHVKVDLPRAAVGRPDVQIAPALGPDPLLTEALRARLSEAGWRPGEPVVLAAAGSADPDATRSVAAQARSPVSPGNLSAARPTVAEAIAAHRASVAGGAAELPPAIPGDSADRERRSSAANPEREASTAGGGDARGRTAGGGDARGRTAGGGDARGRTVGGGSGLGRAAGGAGRAERRVGSGARVAVATYLLAPGHFQTALAAADAEVISAPLGAHPAVARLALRRYDEARHVGK